MIDAVLLAAGLSPDCNSRETVLAYFAEHAHESVFRSAVNSQGDLVDFIESPEGTYSVVLTRSRDRCSGIVSFGRVLDVPAPLVPQPVPGDPS